MLKRSPHLDDAWQNPSLRPPRPPYRRAQAARVRIRPDPAAIRAGEARSAHGLDPTPSGASCRLRASALPHSPSGRALTWQPKEDTPCARLPLHSTGGAKFRRLEGAYAESMLRGYRTDVQIFEAWCAQEGVAAFTAKIATICWFLAPRDRTMRRRPSGGGFLPSARHISFSTTRSDRDRGLGPEPAADPAGLASPPQAGQGHEQLLPRAVLRRLCVGQPVEIAHATAPFSEP